MKRLGLLGTFSDAVSGSYASTINAEIQKEYGALQSACLTVQTVDPLEVESLLAAEDWDRLTNLLLSAARAFTCSQASGIVVCGSRLQPAAQAIRDTLQVPVIDMGFALATRLQCFAIQRVAILGTSTPREEAMWTRALAPRKVLFPSSADTHQVRGILQHAFRHGAPVPASFRFEVLRIVASLRRDGAQALILAAPPLAPVIRLDDTLLTLFDAAEIHASVAGLWSGHRELGVVPPCCLPAA